MFLFCFAASTWFYIRISRVIVLHHIRGVYTNNVSSKAQMSVTKVSLNHSSVIICTFGLYQQIFCENECQGKHIKFKCYIQYGLSAGAKSAVCSNCMWVDFDPYVCTCKWVLKRRFFFILSHLLG